MCNLEHALRLLDDQVGQETEELTQQDNDKLETLTFKYGMLQLQLYQLPYIIE